MKLKFDKKLLLPAGLTLAFIACLVLFQTARAARKDHVRLLMTRAEVAALRDDYSSLKSRVDFVEGRKNVSNVQGVVQAVDEVFRSIGLNGKVKSVKSAGASEKVYGTEEEAEVQVEKINMNEMVNMFYKIENAPMILSIRRSTIKKAFDDPSLLNVTLTLDLIRPK
jgi:hypothetical protein